MVTVIIRQNPPGRSKQLEPWQVMEFLDELRRVNIYWWITFAKGRPKVTVHPDFVIEINRNGKIFSYELYSGQVLYNVRKSRRYQFYMGYTLIDWLFR